MRRDHVILTLRVTLEAERRQKIYIHFLDLLTYQAHQRVRIRKDYPTLRRSFVRMPSWMFA